MLFTRCPECETTFRVTDETLKKANGQVRCGRCASVFNAYAELHDPAAKSFEPEAERPRPAVTRPPIRLQHAPPPAPPPAESKTVEPDTGAPGIGNAAVADVAAEATGSRRIGSRRRGAAGHGRDQRHRSRPCADHDRQHSVRRRRTPGPLLGAWRAPREPQVERCRRARVRGARRAGAASLSFGLAGNSTFGPLLTRVYGVFGAELDAELGRAAVRDHRLGRMCGAELARARQSQDHCAHSESRTATSTVSRSAAASQRSLGESSR